MKHIKKNQKLRQEGAINLLSTNALRTFVLNNPTVGEKKSCDLFINTFKEIKKEIKLAEKISDQTYDEYLAEYGE